MPPLRCLPPGSELLRALPLRSPRPAAPGCAAVAPSSAPRLLCPSQTLRASSSRGHPSTPLPFKTTTSQRFPVRGWCIPQSWETLRGHQTLAGAGVTGTRAQRGQIHSSTAPQWWVPARCPTAQGISCSFPLPQPRPHKAAAPGAGGAVTQSSRALLSLLSWILHVFSICFPLPAGSHCLHHTINSASFP